MISSVNARATKQGPKTTAQQMKTTPNYYKQVNWQKQNNNKNTASR